jgi:hypothetical protein
MVNQLVANISMSIEHCPLYSSAVFLQATQDAAFTLDTLAKTLGLTLSSRSGFAPQINDISSLSILPDRVARSRVCGVNTVRIASLQDYHQGRLLRQPERLHNHLLCPPVHQLLPILTCQCPRVSWVLLLLLP